ncbi:class 1 isoprenoid biosynthesis enzyme [Chitinophagaceae bacterium LB-8]|uniref:Class 1 isoprenoid biosynthesis enzyme n=1 Tax=Paraflavisolibacter caeni TaxID=2982496 RepID=A0A9X2XV71_9BACT|nr:class 1 isoprenoid biosynthesis enzyme [Paraflavisolibacter caeni]MCU7549147.1 class 1 isoprenoid biosynthesis enzyme [Paraflavisolibacter caeni]
MHLFQLVRVSRQLQKEVQSQQQFNKQWLLPLLKSLEIKHNGKFSSATLKKIYNYYGIYVPAVICNSYCKLNGKEMTDQEQQCATMFGILSPLYDDFFDEGTLSKDEIEAITLDPYSYHADTFEEKVFKEIHLWLLQNVPYPERYIETFQQVFLSQFESLRQMDQQLSEEELLKITYDKGYYAFLLYQDILDIKHTEAYKKVLYTFSGLLQLGNDVFDVHKDLHSGIYTLPNLSQNFPAFKKYYFEEAERFREQLMNLDFPTERKKDFLIIINYVVASGWIAILKLEKIYQKILSPEDLMKLERKQLICDMEKPINVVKRFYYCYQFSRGNVSIKSL